MLTVAPWFVLETIQEEDLEYQSQNDQEKSSYLLFKNSLTKPQFPNLCSGNDVNLAELL